MMDRLQSYRETSPISTRIDVTKQAHLKKIMGAEIYDVRFDLQATILHLMGIDHKNLTYRFQGRDFRLTDLHGHVVEDIQT